MDTPSAVGVEETPAPDLSFRGWAARKAATGKGKVANYCRWYAAGAVGEPPAGWSEAAAEFDAYWREAVRAPSIRRATDALAAEALRRRLERPAEPEVDPTWSDLVGVLDDLGEIVDELANYIDADRRRLRIDPRLRRVEDVVRRLRRMTHPSAAPAEVFAANSPADAQEAPR